nr:MAG TPA: hypothetical protein [Caudoviricetes sp.]
METKELKIVIPEGYEIDEENSTFECVKFKKKKEVNIWKDINYLSGYYVADTSEIYEVNGDREDSDKNVFISEKYAKSALALAQISQLMPYYGGEITNKEWADDDWKHSVNVIGNEICITSTWKTRYPITFHTAEDRARFLSFPENVQLVKDFYMID